MSKHLVIVESPAKAKTIEKYLGSDYSVLASYGHVRDLPSKDGMVDPKHDFKMTWQLSAGSKKHVKAIEKSLRDADDLYLATDPDREGEAISWHILNILSDKQALSGKDVKRVTFNEITKSAVNKAFEHPRELDDNLIEAYLARRALDYLVGFTLSPVLWRKLPGARSAGRVQSVALRLISEREAEIEVFVPREYWSVTGMVQDTDNNDIEVRLTHLGDKKLKKFDLGDEDAAQKAVDAITGKDLTIQSIDRRQVRRHPSPPFITSTLQQAASRRLNLSASQTMRIAQKLYEGIDIGGETVGLITYMRTDGTNLSGQAISQSRKIIGHQFGDEYVPDKPRIYKTKAKNAQEAHEAIRPTDLFRFPGKIRSALSNVEYKLYDMIWKRTIAAEMESAVMDQVSVDITDADNTVTLRASGSVLTFDGYYKVYGGRPGEDDTHLPNLNEGQKLTPIEITPNQHFTQPPPRYSEASLVKKLEELGIGRPSTYASIIKVLQDRDYVRLEKKRFVPEDRGRLVTTFLVNFFEKYVEYDFTAELEEDLDDISSGDAQWKKVLADFWNDFSAQVEQVKGLTITDVIDALDNELEPFLFPETDENPNPRACPSCEDGRLGLKLGKFGAFIGCSNYDDCKYTREFAFTSKEKLKEQGEDSDGINLDAGPVELGSDPDTGKTVTLRKGPYGVYVQLGEPEKDEESGKKKKPKRSSVPKSFEVADIDLDTALGLLGLPRTVGEHPETGKDILAGIGRYGPYLKYDGNYTSLPKGENVLTIGMNRAVDLIANAKKKKKRGPIKTLGEHPDDGKKITVHTGRYGPYLKYGKQNVSLPNSVDPEDVTMDLAVATIAKYKSKKKQKKKKK